MIKFVKEAVFAAALKCGIFPADSDKPEKWEKYITESPRKSVEKLYGLWKLCSDLDNPNTRKIERALRHRLQTFEVLQLNKDFLDKYVSKVFYVHAFWDGKKILDYVKQEKTTSYPFYVVDFNNRLRGIAIAEDLILVGALNFPTSVDEAQRFCTQGVFNPLTDKDAELLVQYRKEVRKLMRAAGMTEINGEYLLIDSQTDAWRGYGFNREIAFTAKQLSGGYFLLAKL